MSQPSNEELQKAFASFLICLGSTLPKELAERIASRIKGLSQAQEHNSETNVSKLTKSFSEALLQMHQLQ